MTFGCDFWLRLLVVTFAFDFWLDLGIGMGVRLGIEDLELDGSIDTNPSMVSVGPDISSRKHDHELENVSDEDWYCSDEGPPRSNLHELQYLYRRVRHKSCGTQHNRLETCKTTGVHGICGQRHGFAKNCDGSWKTLAEIESLAGFMSETKREKELAEMTEFEKKEITCMDWNRGKCSFCKFGDRKRHLCSKMIIEGNSRKPRICWGFHKEIDHKNISRKRTGGQ